MFTEVYDEMPVDLKKQMDQMEQHVNLYKDQYPLKNYAKQTFIVIAFLVLDYYWWLVVENCYYYTYKKV